MPDPWRDIGLQTSEFTNVDEAVLRQANAALENAFVNDAGGWSRFAGLMDFATLSGNSPTYLWDWKDDLIAVSNSQTWRVDSNGVITDVTGVPVKGSGRPIFDKTEDELLIAAGGPIVRLAGEETEILSEDAPESTHVAYIDGYVLAIEIDSGRFFHSQAGVFRAWNPLDVFTASGKPDNLNSMVITPFRELLLCGPDSIEQFERISSGDTPFFRRWAVAEGIKAPYTVITADDGTWGVNLRNEFVRFSGQTSRSEGDQIGRALETVSDWTDAWTALVHIQGQKFILLQIPHATNVHGTKGITALFDYRRDRWSSLFGWDSDRNVPARWPGWSYRNLWGRHFVGGNGKVYELDTNTFISGTQTQRLLGRTAHFDALGEVEIKNFRLRLKRGVVDSNADIPLISVRARRDNNKWTKWKRKPLGRAGNRDAFIEFGNFGCAHTWQFEFVVTDQCPVEIVVAQAQITRLGE